VGNSTKILKMLRKFRISAPGKIILHGEHSVVYGKPAIAGPINLRTYFTFNKINSNFIEFNYKRLDLIAQLSLDNANKFLSEIDCYEKLQPIDFLNKIRESKEFILNYIKVTRELSDKEFMAISSTIFILNRILRSEKILKIESSFEIEIDSEISIGAGCGSSASYGVCLAAGFLTIAKLIKSENLEKFSDQNLEKISQFAFDSEVLMHEKPSGIDNTICTYGQLVKFLRGQKPISISTNTQIDIVIVDTKVSRSTSQLVAKVANFKDRFPQLANSIFDAMGYLADDVVNILENQNENNFEDLNKLVEVNNNLLRSIGVSHQKLEQIFTISNFYGFNSKLTGAGGGGCAFILLPKDYENMEKYHQITNELKQNGFDITTTSIISGTGVDLKFDY
jgi:mevalonate kinase